MAKPFTPKTFLKQSSLEEEYTPANLAAHEASTKGIVLIIPKRLYAHGYRSSQGKHRLCSLKRVWGAQETIYITEHSTSGA